MITLKVFRNFSDCISETKSYQKKVIFSLLVSQSTVQVIWEYSEMELLKKSIQFIQIIFACISFFVLISGIQHAAVLLSWKKKLCHRKSHCSPSWFCRSHLFFLTRITFCILCLCTLSVQKGWKIVCYLVIKTVDIFSQ